MDLCADGLKETKFESVPSLYANAQIGKDEEPLMRAVDILQMIEAGDAAPCRVPCLTIGQKVKLLVLFRVG